MRPPAHFVWSMAPRSQGTRLQGTRRTRLQWTPTWSLCIGTTSAQEVRSVPAAAPQFTSREGVGRWIGAWPVTLWWLP